ncbi:MAG: helix-turn-helix domain-containing protein [Dysgonamonadaceae bacterium]|jgi:transcriptional regulator with XRE-family HTH domain|nr:helix-turn-helix domain-containing protein [Dysgonamonadaceae bacterium]
MLFANRIKELREEKQMLQRHVSAALDIDNAMYCKIERGDRQAKRKQVLQLSKLFDADQNELLNLWLADKVYDIVGEEDNASNVLSIVAENIVEYQKIK